jgi:hypothetical protein
VIDVTSYSTFQAAYDDLPDEGGTIYVPAGTYEFGPNVDPDPHPPRFKGLEITTKPVVLLGDGSAPAGPLSIIELHEEHFQNADAILITLLGGCVLKNIYLHYPDDMPAGQGRAIKWYVPGAEIGMAGLTLENVAIENSPNLAVECTCDDWPGDDDHDSNYISKLEMVGCTIANSKSGGSLFVGGAGANNNWFERCEFNGPGFGGFHNVPECSFDANSTLIAAEDFSSVREGDEVRGLGMRVGTTVESVDTASTPNTITIGLAANARIDEPGTTFTFYRADGPDEGQLPRGAVHLLRTSISRFHLCSFQGPGESPALSTDLVSNNLVLRDAYREISGTGSAPSFILNGMSNFLIDGLFHNYHAYNSLLLKTGPAGLIMGRIFNAQLTTDVNPLSGTDEIADEPNESNVIELSNESDDQRDFVECIGGTGLGPDAGVPR